MLTPGWKLTRGKQCNQIFSPKIWKKDNQFLILKGEFEFLNFIPNTPYASLMGKISSLIKWRTLANYFGTAPQESCLGVYFLQADPTQKISVQVVWEVILGSLDRERRGKSGKGRSSYSKRQITTGTTQPLCMLLDKNCPTLGGAEEVKIWKGKLEE